MSQTRKLYYEDVTCLQFTAAVLECRSSGENFDVVLDATAFYPRAGGQPADRGALGGTTVLDVYEQDGVIYHTVTAPLYAGAVVEGDVDGERRMDHTQQHSGEHIVSGIVHMRLGYENVGFHIGEKQVTVDFSGPISAQELEDIEREANWIIWQDRPVTILWPTESERAALSYRSKKPIEGAVRIVDLGGVDRCACCGTHVQRTGEVAAVKITGAQSYKGGTRVTMLCGKRAFYDYCTKFAAQVKLSRRLSTPVDALPQAVERLVQENAALKAQQTQWEDRIAALHARSVQGKRDALVFEPGFSAQGMRRLCTELCKVCPGVCAVFSGTDDEGYQYVLGGGDVPAFGMHMDEALSGRGGGKELRQGHVSASQRSIEAFFAENTAR